LYNFFLSKLMIKKIVCSVMVRAMDRMAVALKK